MGNEAVSSYERVRRAGLAPATSIGGIAIAEPERYGVRHEKCLLQFGGIPEEHPRMIMLAHGLCPRKARLGIDLTPRGFEEARPYGLVQGGISILVVGDLDRDRIGVGRHVHEEVERIVEFVVE